MPSGDRNEMRRLLERVLSYEIKATELYDAILEKLTNTEIKKKIEGIRDSELRHEEMVRKKLRRFQEK
jgi:rubrerythrin